MIDEADRLLAQSFQDWLAQVLAATRPPRPSDGPSARTQGRPDLLTRSQPDGLAPSFLHMLRDSQYVRTDFDEVKEASCQKMLFSATLTRDPAKLNALGLRHPKYIVVQSTETAGPAGNKEEGMLDFVMEKFTMPATLTVRPSPTAFAFPTPPPN